MKDLKVFLDHFCFALIAVFVGMIVLSLMWGTLGGAMDLAGAEDAGTRFSVTGNIWLMVILWVIISTAIAVALTVVTIKNRPKDQIVFTKRQY